MSQSGFTRVELEYCKKVTEKLVKHPLSFAFRRPVNPQLDGAPDYFQKIAHPMDLGTIKQNLEDNAYPNSKAWAADIYLVWSNCMKYNNKKTLLHHVAERLNQKCIKLLKTIPKTEPDLWAMKLSKINHKFKSLLNETLPEESTVPRIPELALHD